MSCQRDDTRRLAVGIVHFASAPFPMKTSWLFGGDRHPSIVNENRRVFIQGVYNEMNHVCDCIPNGTQPETGSLAFDLEVMKIHEAALASNGERIEIE